MQNALSISCSTKLYHLKRSKYELYPLLKFTGIFPNLVDITTNSVSVTMKTDI